MDARIIIIIAFSYLYASFEAFMNFRQRGKATVTAAGYKGSIWLLIGAISVGYALSFAVGATKIGRMPYWDTLFAVGAALVVIGLSIRIQAILTLKQQFTYSVAKVENQTLIETGLYKIIRHPGYLGQLLIFLGISIALSNWLSILLMMIPVAVGYLYRIKVEESFLVSQLGAAYLDYQKRTRSIIPMIY
jgi:protein-S-isoprenylcysteine O-methyltransferase Ste14